MLCTFLSDLIVAQVEIGECLYAMRETERKMLAMHAE